jgi:hypothetical protein
LKAHTSTSLTTSRAMRRPLEGVQVVQSEGRWSGNRDERSPIVVTFEPPAPARHSANWSGAFGDFVLI